jgi:solute carrier family 6 (neurotransmitter transporter, glycine) member 5/9
MPLPQLWAILFFFMLLILGLGSQFGSIQMMTSSIIDHWPHLRGVQWRVTLGVCLFCFIAGLPMTCNGGVYLKTLIEWHTASWNIFLVGFAEIIVLAWIYGINKTLDNINEMGMKLMRVTRYYWKAVWFVLTPLTLLAVFAFIMTDLGPTEFRGYVFPVWADIIGWMFGAITLMPFLVFAIIQLVKARPNYRDVLRKTEQWGPQEVDGRRVDRAKMI